jgi:hypothetical protein
VLGVDGVIGGVKHGGGRISWSWAGDGRIDVEIGRHHVEVAGENGRRAGSNG